MPSYAPKNTLRVSGGIPQGILQNKFFTEKQFSDVSFLRPGMDMSHQPPGPEPAWTRPNPLN